MTLAEKARDFEAAAQAVEKAETGSDNGISARLRGAADTIRGAIYTSTQITGAKTGDSVLEVLPGDIQGEHHPDRTIKADKNMVQAAALEGDEETLAGLLTHEGNHDLNQVESERRGEGAIADTDLNEALTQAKTRDVDLKNKGRAGKVEKAYIEHDSKVDQIAAVEDEAQGIERTSRAKVLQLFAEGRNDEINRRWALATAA